MKTRRIMLACLVASLVACAVFIWAHQDRARRNEAAQLRHHAEVVAGLLASGVDASPAAYLALAARDHGYRSVTVSDAQGRVILDLAGPASNWIEARLASLGLMPEYSLTAPMTVAGAPSGSLAVLWPARGIYLYLAVLLYLALTLAGLWFFLRERDAKRMLESRVSERAAALEAEIRERVRAEVALKESQRKYRDLVEGSDDLITIVDREGRFLFVNYRSVEVFGLTPGQCLGRSAFDFIHPDDRQATIDWFEAALKAGQSSASIENRQVNRDGGVRHLLWTTNIHHGPDGAVQEISGIGRDVTLRKLAEEALRASEEKFAKAFRHGPMLMTISALEDGTLLEVNDAWCRVSGHSRQESLGRRSVDLGWMTAEQRQSLVEKLLAKGSLQDEEATAWAKDGRPILLLFSAEIILLAERRVLLVSAVDITGRKQAEEMQKAQLVQQRLTMDLAQVVNWEYDALANIFTFNEQFYALYGTTAAEQGGFQMRPEVYASRFLPPEEIPLVQQEIATALAASDPNYISQLEHRIIRADGQERHISVRFAIVKDERGRTVRTYGANQDITERKRMYAELAEQEKQARTIFEQAAVGMAISTPGGVWLQVNQRLCEILGYSREELLRLTYKGITHPDNLANDTERVRQMVAGVRRADSWEKRYIRKDQREVLARLTTALARDEQGRPSYFITVIEDITEVRRAEAEKAALEVQLRQAQKMEAIGTLAGGIAHDFNNILAAVIGFAEMALEDAKLGLANPDDLMQILASAQRAKDLVSQILTFSRKKEIGPQVVDVNQVVRGTREILARTLPKMIAIEISARAERAVVLGDATQLEQVILNLATNARDAMPEGGRLTIRTSNQDLGPDHRQAHPEVIPGAYVRLEIIDSGQGMDADTLEHIFEPFYTTKEVGKGTGLGLSSAYGTVKSHGGHIHCASAPGRGTTFEILLPVLAERGQDGAAEPDAGLGGGLKGHELVLLVDDEESLRLIGRRTLEGNGYRVLTAASGEEALAICRERGPEIDLVLMDLGMPGMGGLKALQAILALRPRTRIVIASGYAATDQVKAALEAGAAGYVAKPFSQRDLLTAVRQALDNR